MILTLLQCFVVAVSEKPSQKLNKPSESRSMFFDMQKRYKIISAITVSIIVLKLRV